MTLPTEAQWEFATRARTTSPWCTGIKEASLLLTANLKSFSDGAVHHSPVGLHQSNAFGLHDVHGNVAEWCCDHHGSYLIAVAPGDGLRTLADKQRYITRGGSFIKGGEQARSASRANNAANQRIHEIGLRPARPVMR